MRRTLAIAALFSAFALGACSHMGGGPYASAGASDVTAGSGSSMPPANGVNATSGYSYDDPWGSYGYEDYGTDWNTGPNTMYQND